MRPRLDASHERMFGEKNSLFGVTAHLDKRRTESFFLQTFFHRSEEHTSELQSRSDLVCRLLLEKKKSILPRFPFPCYPILIFLSLIRGSRGRSTPAHGGVSVFGLMCLDDDEQVSRVTSQDQPS